MHRTHLVEAYFYHPQTDLHMTLVLSLVLEMGAMSVTHSATSMVKVWVPLSATQTATPSGSCSGLSSVMLSGSLSVLHILHM
jgi:hypothetical protein